MLASRLLGSSTTSPSTTCRAEEQPLSQRAGPVAQLPFLLPSAQLWPSPRTVPNQASSLEHPEATCPPARVLVWGEVERGCTVLSRVGASCRSLYWLDPISMRPLPLLLQSGQVGLECHLSRPLASSRRKRPNEWSGCRQLASGIISFVARRLIPQLPPPYQSRGAVGTAGAITGWGCASGEVGDWRNAGGTAEQAPAGEGKPSLCPQRLGPWLWMGGAGGALLQSFLQLLKVLPAFPLFTCPPSVCLPSCPAAGMRCAPLLSLLVLPGWGCSIFPSNPELLFHLISHL